MDNTTLEGKVDRLVTDVAQIRTALQGYNGGTGLLKTFEQHCNQDREFKADYYSFKRKCLAVFFTLVGSGAIGTGIFKLTDLAK